MPAEQTDEAVGIAAFVVVFVEVVTRFVVVVEVVVLAFVVVVVVKRQALLW